MGVWPKHSSHFKRHFLPLFLSHSLSLSLFLTPCLPLFTYSLFQLNPSLSCELWGRIKSWTDRAATLLERLYDGAVTQQSEASSFFLASLNLWRPGGAPHVTRGGLWQKKQVRRSIYEFLWVNNYLKGQFSHFLLFLSESSQLARVTHTTEPKGTIIIYWKCILGVYCNFFLCQTHTAASAGSSGDDWLLWTCGRVIPGFDRLRRMASALCAKKRPLQKMLSGCRSVLGENIKITAVCVCVSVCFCTGPKKCTNIPVSGEVCSLMIHHITLGNAVQTSSCIIFPPLRLNERKNRRC